MTQRLRIEQLWDGETWKCPGFVEVDDAGTIVEVADGPPSHWRGETIATLDGYVVPGVPNTHSHAHHRLIAGRAEAAAPDRSGGSLWTWRKTMYRWANTIDPDGLEAAALLCYIEMLKAGFTVVGEFHYLHHAPGGAAYANSIEMSERLCNAGQRSGIALTLLPVLYTSGSFGGPLLPAQQRFAHSAESYVAFVERVMTLRTPTIEVGLAPHSIRAVKGDELVAVLDAFANGKALPVHVHVCERPEEVSDAVAAYGRSPIAWFADTYAIDENWTFVHATHATDEELQRIVDAGARIALCPATEANLGDGFFPLDRYGELKGKWAIGTDANMAISLIDELRTLEVSQRLRLQRRDVLTGLAGDTRHPGEVLLGAALRNGAVATRRRCGRIAPGHQADLVRLDAGHPALIEHSTETVLDAWLFASSENPVRDVMVQGSWVIRDGRHEAEEEALKGFAAAVRRISGKLRE